MTTHSIIDLSVNAIAVSSALPTSSIYLLLSLDCIVKSLIICSRYLVRGVRKDTACPIHVQSCSAEPTAQLPQAQASLVNNITSMVCSGSKSNIWLIIFTNIRKSCPFIASHHLSFWFTKHKLVLLRARTWWSSIQLPEGMFKFPHPSFLLRYW